VSGPMESGSSPREGIGTQIQVLEESALAQLCRDAPSETQSRNAQVRYVCEVAHLRGQALRGTQASRVQELGSSEREATSAVPAGG